MPSPETHYQTLNIPPTSAPPAIRHAYKTLSLRHHPDKPHGSTTAFAQLQQAYHVLIDPQRRAAYDALLRRVVSEDVHLVQMQQAGGYWPCRCGGAYWLEQDVECIVPCDTCSLAVRVFAGRETLEAE